MRSLAFPVNSVLNVMSDLMYRDSTSCVESFLACVELNASLAPPRYISLIVCGVWPPYLEL